MKLLLSALLSLSTILIFAQHPQGNRPSVQVKGTVIDRDSKQPLEYATIICTPEKGQVTGGITDEKGHFDFNIFTGTYTISIEFISYKTKTLPKQLIKENLNLGNIILEPEAESLSEVEIIAEKSTVEVKLDKKIYNVGQDMTIKGGTATDVLENVPSVTVDVDGNVSLRGNESVRILIDGKPSGLVGLSSTDVLRQLPADAIQKVEVITSPSARYEAEGTAGIINIVLRKGKVQGFNSSYSVNVGIPESYGVAANLNYKDKKYNLFSNLGYNYRTSEGYSNFYNFLNNNENNKKDEEFRDQTRVRNGFNINLGMDYFVTDKATLTGSVLYRNSPSESEAASTGLKYDTNQNITETSLRTENQDEDNSLTEYALNFTQNFSKDNHQWKVDVKYQDNSENQLNTILENNTFPTSSFVSHEKNTQDESEKNWLIKSDYVLPLGEKQQFEAGFQTNLTHRIIDTKYDEFDGTTHDISGSLMDYNQNVTATYVQYGNKINQFSYLAGLRFEYTNFDMVVNQSNLVKKEYNNWFPTLNMTYEFNDKENITLGYNRRIRRPQGHMLNPFPSRSSLTNYFTGNIDLDPVISDSYDLGYFKKWEKVSLNTSVYFNHANNAFQFVRVPTGEEINGVAVIKAQPINLNKEDRIGGELAINYSPLKMLQFNNSFNFYRFSTNGSYLGIDYTGSNTSWNNRFATKMKFSKKTDFQFTFMYEGPYKTTGIERKAGYVGNAAFSVDVLKDNGTLSLNVNDLFNSRKREAYTYYQTFSSFATMQWQKRQINLNFTYRFNQKKKQTRPQRETENEGQEMM